MSDDIDQMYPALAVEDPRACGDWYREHFGFQVVWDTGWYVSLRKPATQRGDRTHELAFVRFDHASVPPDSNGERHPVRGVLVNIEVPNVEEAWLRLCAPGAPLAHRVARPRRLEEWGQDHVILRGPGGELVDVIEVVPVTGVDESTDRPT